MTNRSRGRNSRPQQMPVKGVPIPGAQSMMGEPQVRRWPHPVGGMEEVPQNDPALYYIRCSLSYQNQLLAEMKALLERIELSQREGKQEN